MDMCFIGKIDGPSIEEYIAYHKEKYPSSWKLSIVVYLREEALQWGDSVFSTEMFALPYEAYENIFLDKWSNSKHKYQSKRPCLFSGAHALLHLHGCIQQEKVLVSINPSCNHNFINVNLTKRLQLPAKHIQST